LHCRPYAFARFSYGLYGNAGTSLLQGTSLSHGSLIRLGPGRCRVRATLRREAQFAQPLDLRIDMAPDKVGRELRAARSAKLGSMPIASTVFFTMRSSWSDEKSRVTNAPVAAPVPIPASI